MRCDRALVLGAFLLALSAPVWAENWPQFRGPTGQGLTSESALPTEWTAEKMGSDKDKNVAWKVAVPGVAWSQPIVWGDKIIVTTAITDNQPKPSSGGGGFGRPGGGFGGPGGGRPGGGGFGPPGGGRPERDEDAAPSEEKKSDAGEKKSDAGEKKADEEKKGEDAPRPEARPGGGRQRPGGGFGGPGGGRPGGGFGGRGSSPPNAVYQWKVLCLDRKDGHVLWEHLLHEGKPTISIHGTNTYASETPITDGERVYIYVGMQGLYCYDLDGKQLWSKKFDSYPMMAGWGTGSSPALDGDRVFIQCDNEQKSYLVAFDKKTGEELWRKSRDERSNWSTPFIWKNKDRTELVTAGGTKMRAYDPKDGALLWEMSGTSGRCSATPVGDSSLLYVGTGGGMGGSGPLVAIKAGAKGDISLKGDEESNAGVAWIVDRAGPPMASPLLHKGCVYVLDQRGGLIGCYDATTGKQHYRERLPGAKGFTSSPWAVGDKVFCLDESGQTFVLAAGPELKVLGTNKIDDMFWSSAAVAGDKLLLRGLDKLYCIGLKE